MQKIREEIRSYCAQCKGLCPIIAHLKNGTFSKVLPDKDHPNANVLCPKGIVGPELVYSPQRLKYPLLRKGDKLSSPPAWERISWDSALEIVAAKLGAIKSRYGSEAVAFYRCGPGGSPAQDFNDLVMRLAHAFGSPNTVATTHICNWHKDVSVAYTFGTGLLDPEIDKAACILLWGHNPHASWRSHVRDIEIALRRGAKLIVVDPRRTEAARKADLWLQIHPSTDGALALAMIHVIIHEKLFEYEFVRDWTTAPFLVRCDNGDLLKGSDLETRGRRDHYIVWDTNTDSLRQYNPDSLAFEDPSTQPALMGTYHAKLADGRSIECKTAFQLLVELVSRYEPEKVERIVRVPSSKIKQAARMFGTVKPACYYTYNGIEQQTNATQTHRAISLLYALTGNFDKKGSNRFFARPAVKRLHGIEFLSPEIEKKRLGLQERPLGPAGTLQPIRYQSIRATDVYKAILTGKPYPVKGLVAFGGNMITANPNSLKGREALSRLDFYVQAELFLTPAAELADIVLPSASFWEGWHVRAGFMQSEEASRHVQLRQMIVPPQHECWPDHRIIFEMAKRLGIGDKFWDGDIEAGFNSQLAVIGMTVQDLREHPGGINLRLAQEETRYRRIDTKSGVPVGFNTPSRRIEMYSQIFKDHGVDPLPVYQESLVNRLFGSEQREKFPMTLIVTKLLEYCHGWGRSLPTLRNSVPDPFAQINPENARQSAIQDGEWVFIESPYGSIKVKAMITDEVAVDVVCTQHGWWEGCDELGMRGYDPYSSEGANVNLLFTDEVCDPVSGSLPLKGFPCRIRKQGPD